VDTLRFLELSRVLLTAAPLPHEPYHDAKRGRPDDVEKTVAAAAEEARRHAFEAIRTLAASVGGHGYQLVASGVVLGGGRPDRTLSQALATHAAMHGAEGWLFREALIEASQSCGLVAVGVHESELPGRAAAALGATEVDVRAMVDEFGRGHGPPWARDQKTAAMAALVALRVVSEQTSAPA
jgi:hypothetical protein